MVKKQITSKEFPDGGFEFAWKWFDFHAKQRQSNIQFSISFLTATLAGTGYLIAQGISVLSLITSLAGLLLCVVFYGLDCRNAFLVKLAEKHLVRFEQTLDVDGNIFDILRASENKNRFMIKYSWGARILFSSYALIFFFGCLVSLFFIVKTIS